MGRRWKGGEEVRDGARGTDGAGGRARRRPGARARIRSRVHRLASLCRRVPGGSRRHRAEAHAAPGVPDGPRARGLAPEHPTALPWGRPVQEQRRRRGARVARLHVRHRRRAQARRSHGVQAVPRAGTHPRVRLHRSQPRDGPEGRREAVSVGGGSRRRDRRRRVRDGCQVPRRLEGGEDAQRAAGAGRREGVRRRAARQVEGRVPGGRRRRPPGEHPRFALRAHDALPGAEDVTDGRAGRRDCAVAIAAHEPNPRRSVAIRVPRRHPRARAGGFRSTRRGFQQSRAHAGGDRRGRSGSVRGSVCRRARRRGAGHVGLRHVLRVRGSSASLGTRRVRVRRRGRHRL
mmetsp:Transcript_8488/g.34711  ORF Transcript_8488/g.34711 Transcript_8488/m.34711 type:complete len:346 (+) Transcript_8488:1419-2456(+)